MQKGSPPTNNTTVPISSTQYKRLTEAYNGKCQVYFFNYSIFLLKKVYRYQQINDKANEYNYILEVIAIETHEKLRLWYDVGN